MKNAFVIVDGYSSGRMLVDAFKEKLENDPDTVIVHVQSTPLPYTTMLAPEIEKYAENIVLNGDVQEVLTKLKQYNVVAVVAGQEPGVELADTLSEKLGLVSSNGTEKSAARRNKYEMVKAIADAGLPAPKFIKSNNLSEILNWVQRETHYPVVIKALRSAGTDGVFISRNEEELKAAYGKLFGSETIYNELNDEVLVESFLEGCEYVVNAVSLNGEHYVTDVWLYEKKFIPGHGNIYDRETLVPSSLPEVQALIQYNAKVLDALGIMNGPSHAEIMFTPSGPVLVEVGARISGVVHPKLNTACVGHDQVHLTVECYSDPEKFKSIVALFPYAVQKHGMVINAMYEGLPGKIESIDETVLEQLKTLPSMEQVIVRAKVDAMLNPTRTQINSPARFFLCHQDSKQIEEDYATIQRLMKRLFRLTPQLTARPATVIEEMRLAVVMAPEIAQARTLSC